VVTLAWTAPGDDWLCGQAANFRIIASEHPIHHPSDGTVVGDFPATAAAGGSEAELITNLNQENRYFAVLYQDDAGNWGHLASAVLPFQTPQSASPITVSLVPSSRQCGTGANPADGQHSPPLGTDSCLPPATTGFAHSGTQSTGAAQLSVIPGNTGTPADEADVSITASLTDVRGTSPTGADYDPNPAGADLTLVERLRLTDFSNGPGEDEAGTTTDLDFSVPVSCATTSDPGVGSTCAANTSADAVLPGAIKEGKQTVIGVFRIRVNDSGPNGTRADADDRLFQQQGVYVP
jgi:hypothetical protein